MVEELDKTITIDQNQNEDSDENKGDEDEEEELDDVLWKLRQAYIIDGGDQFRKSFEKILSEYGYHT